MKVHTKYILVFKTHQNFNELQDLLCENFRSREQSWEYCKIALDFFNEYRIPFWEMKNSNKLINNEENEKGKYCLAKLNELYIIYLGYTETTELDLTDSPGKYSVKWYNPREGGLLQDGSVTSIVGGEVTSIGHPPLDSDKDWVAIVKLK